MVKLCDLSFKERQCIVDYVNVIFGVYHVDADSVTEFWERVKIGNIKTNMV